MLANAGRNTLEMHNNFEQLQVVLPESLSGFFAEQGYCKSTYNEERSHARLNIRCEARIHIDQSSSIGLLQPESWGTVLIKDLSKTGVALLYHAQIYPGLVFELLFRGRVITARATRCRRIADKCFEIGASIEGVVACSELVGELPILSDQPQVDVG